ncbi:hypothetical protein SSP24_35590 [Streptomyces spinoverrucosus]|uniref:Uncharacterized protein n=1 Tax=Streptomyces spinoverrucosus TaxID=284043 RepID=A0A4Y3VG69_9ACTN|nr:hypothetical protein SSP24_35590 [Streptomyces spinoverrucosus]GHB74544.1 hypothetical protein GCM10010397_51300 [Streptomyces spinoverrucosus]
MPVGAASQRKAADSTLPTAIAPLEPKAPVINPRDSTKSHRFRVTDLPRRPEGKAPAALGVPPRGDHFDRWGARPSGAGSCRSGRWRMASPVATACRHGTDAHIGRRMRFQSG